MTSANRTEQIRNLEDLNHASKADDGYLDLKAVVAKAQSFGIAGWTEAKVELDRLLLKENNLQNGHGQQQITKPFSQTLPAALPSGRPADDMNKKRSNSPSRADRMITVSALEYKRLVESESMNKAKVEELTNRLSSFVSKQLKDGNPNIADLSDKNRPTKLGEQFEQLYDNEWSDAYECLKEDTKEEDKIVQTLVDITQRVHEFCCDFSQQQLNRLEGYYRVPMTEIKWTVQSDDGDHVMQSHRNPEDKTAFFELPKYIKESRKACATASIPALREVFKGYVYREHFSNITLKRNLEAYIDKCVECIWLMVVQDPPMDLRYARKGENLDTTAFKVFRKKGTVVQACIWPAVYLHKNGPVVCRGFVLPQ
ncbi:uncharacterized protein LOC125679718 isoform X2 [Ostrea edulis]|uniref:uncharacterized protein LOC125679718 isoform X2 n=1 Tax=Ostrea edulis TaxID=37623 RepID=UPI002095464F|nr:uncharacterized protein LOC125679718 isoform X2 [Ostrea edulis]